MGNWIVVNLKIAKFVTIERISFVLIPIDSSLSVLSMTFWVKFDMSKCLAAIIINSQ
jgi:hypothetical protein